MPAFVVVDWMMMMFMMMILILLMILLLLFVVVQLAILPDALYSPWVHLYQIPPAHVHAAADDADYSVDCGCSFGYAPVHAE